jgi:hypothetical protein
MALIIRVRQPYNLSSFPSNRGDNLRSSVYPKIFTLIIIAPILLAFLSGCSSAASSSQEKQTMASMNDMPADVKSAPVTVQQAYQFAAANPDVMKQIPCYCGCGAMGHTSNYACYVDEVDVNGKVTFDTHALGCSICVDITQDTMRLIKQGKAVPDIKLYIDQTYSQYGPSNIP